MASIAELARHGRKGDTMIGHLTPGDVVIPRDVIMQEPQFLVRLKKIMEEGGGDYRTHMVGSGYDNINPATGMPEYGWFSKITRPITRAVKKVGSIAGDLGSSVDDMFMQPSLDIAKQYGPALAATAIGGPQAGLAALSATGGIGGSGGGSIGSAYGGGQDVGSIFPEEPAPIELTRAPEAALPSSLSHLQGLSGLQQSTNIATEGLYGGGVGQEEQEYFANLLNRRLMDESGQLASYGEVRPVEEQFLRQRVGLRFDPNTKSILEALQARSG